MPAGEGCRDDDRRERAHSGSSVLGRPLRVLVVVPSAAEEKGCRRAGRAVLRMLLPSCKKGKCFGALKVPENEMEKGG